MAETNFLSIETALLQRWHEANLFALASQPNDSRRPCYAIPLPPPNVTGMLHMGHAFQQTLMDILIRFHRMLGYRVHWQIGTDHAGIATQLVVEKQLRRQGTDLHSLSQEAFLDAAVDWKNRSSETILHQMRRLGLHIDLKSSRFTLDPDYREAVTQAFVQLHEAGLIYRGQRLVNWDPYLKTAISDLEVISQPGTKRLYFLRYPSAARDGRHLVVATTRPETLFGDVAVAVHPEDPRYADWLGQRLLIPMTERSIPVVAHLEVDPEYGTGAVKITPAHDFLDERIGRSLGLPAVQLFDESGCFLKEARFYPDPYLQAEAIENKPWIPKAYQGQMALEVRPKLCAELEARGWLEDSTLVEGDLPVGERSGQLIEPRLTAQWFLKAQPMGEAAKQIVENGALRFYPSTYKKAFFAWMDRLEDWCISRQLRWGHPLPVWWDSEGRNYFVGAKEAEVRLREGLDDSVALHPESDVLDTWFSSALWSFASLGWPQKSELRRDFHPTHVVVSGFDILNFWIARMIMVTQQICGEVPFQAVVVTGLIRDEHGAKMSKSKGNVLDPMDLIEGISLEGLIQKRESDTLLEKDRLHVRTTTQQAFPEGFEGCGADALRLTLASLANQGRDIHWSTPRLRGYRNFCNKLSNAFKLIEKWLTLLKNPSANHEQHPLVNWTQRHWDGVLTVLHGHLQNYRFDCAVQTLYDYTWHQFCDWTLEWTKPLVYAEHPDAAIVAYGTAWQFESLLRALHPFMPFITEHLWLKLRHALGQPEAGSFLVQQAFPQPCSEVPTAEAERWWRFWDWMQKVVEASRATTSCLCSQAPASTPFRLQFFQETEAPVWLQRFHPLWASCLKRPLLAEVNIQPQGQPSTLIFQSDYGEVNLELSLSAQRALQGQRLAELQATETAQRAQAEALQTLLNHPGFLSKAAPAVIQEKRAGHQSLLLSLKRLQSEIQELQTHL